MNNFSVVCGLSVTVYGLLVSYVCRNSYAIDLKLFLKCLFEVDVVYALPVHWKMSLFTDLIFKQTEIRIETVRRFT